MPTLISPAATPGMPLIEMPDTIDSLKRLERIGSESSKTVEKIISAARDIECKIASLYTSYGAVNISPDSVLMEGTGRFFDEEKMTARAGDLGLSYYDLGEMKYEIDSHGAMFRNSSAQSVSQNRESALHFAKDLANGLLVIIEEDLKQREAENQKALGLLENARKRPG